MNRKLSELPRISALQDGYLVPAVRDGVNYVFNTATLKSYLTKADMGLSAIDNTSDINKPISAATQTAISGLSAILFNKTDIGHLHPTSDISGLTNMFSGYSRINHTHTVADITDLVLPNMSLYATVQDVLARTTEARVLQLITQNTTGAVDLGPTNVRIDNAIIRIAGAEANVVQNQITANAHSAQISSINNRVDAIEATGLDTADLQTINNQFTVLTNSLSAKASVIHTHTTSQITDFAATVGNLIASVVNVNAINADLNGMHADLLAIHTSLDGKAATTHIHAISNITGLQAALDAKSGITHVHDFNGVTGLQTALDSKAGTTHVHTDYAAVIHTHVITDTIGLEAELASKAEASHTHNNYAPIVHIHSIADVTGLQTALVDINDQIAQIASAGGSGNGTSAPLIHTHVIASVTGLQSALDNKTDLNHDHFTSDITGLNFELASINNLIGDPYYENTSLLLHLDGIIGNTVLTDSSYTPKTVVNPTSVQITSTQNQHGKNSVYFNGVSNYLSIPSSNDFNFGLDDFTLEAFVYKNTNADNIVINRQEPSNGMALWLASSGFLVRSTGGGTHHFLQTADVPANSWTHLAGVRYKSTFMLFVNGVVKASEYLPNIVLDCSRPIAIGALDDTLLTAFFNGYISDVRITKGVARYTENFTVLSPSFPDKKDVAAKLTDLTAVVTSLSSQSSNTLTTTELLTTDLAAKAPLVHNHALIDITGLQTALDAKASAVHSHVVADVTGLQTMLNGKANVGHMHTEYAPIAHNHVVSEVNGLQSALDNKTSIGHVHQTSDITGLNTLLASVLGEFAITTVSSGDVDFNSVVLLLHGDGTNNSTNIVDSSSFNKIATIVGNTVISTTQSKFNGSSLYFNGNGSYISYLPHTDFDLGTNHTFEAWVYYTAGVAKGILSYTTDQHPYMQTMASYIWYIAADGLLKFSVNGSGTSDIAISTTAVPASTWSHIAVVKTGQVVTQYVNGFLVSTDTLQNSGNPTDSSWRFRIGTYYTDALPFNGYIDDLRITKGVARYSANFTPIAQAFPDSIGDLTDPNFADVMLLLHAEGGNATNSFVDSSPLPATLTTVGSVIHTTGFKKFGNSSIETSDKYSKIQVVKSSNIDLTGNYTIECFVRTNSNTNTDYNSIITTNDNVFPGRYGLDFGVTGNNTLVARIVTASNAAVFSATSAYTLGDLVHIAFVNNNTSNIFNIFINGVLSGTRAAVPFFNNNTFQIAKCSNDWAETPYQIDELRITKGVVRYIANFTPPTMAFPNAVPVAPTSGNLTTALASKSPLVHMHVIANTTGLQAALDAKANIAHEHTTANIIGLDATLANLAAQIAAGGGSGSVTSVAVAGTAGRITSSGGPITSAGTVTLDLAATGVAAGTYSSTDLTVDEYGRITYASSGSTVVFSPFVGYNNIAISENTTPLTYSTGDFNLAIGHNALIYNTTGVNNIAVGTTSLNFNTIGYNNTAVGYESLINNIAGNSNTSIGLSSGYNNTSGSNNTYVGSSAGFNNQTYNNVSCFGYNSNITNNNQVQLGGTGTTTYVYGTVQNRSDLRDKADVRGTLLGLDFINSLRPVDYKWDMREDYKSDMPIKPELSTDATDEEIKASDDAYKAAVAAYIETNKLVNLNHDGSKKRSRYHHGFIAQEVQQLIESSGADFGGFQNHAASGGEDVLSIGYDEFIAPLVRAVQELTLEKAKLKNTLDSTVELLKSALLRIEALESK